MKNSQIYSQNNSPTNTKYWTPFEMRFNFLYATEQRWATPFNIWGFENLTHPNYTKKPFTGYALGMGFYLRPAKYFDFFLIGNVHKNKTLIADAGDHLKSGELVYDFIMNGPGEIPPIPNTTYFLAKTVVLTPGVRFIYPKKPGLELWLGMGYNLGTSTISFTDKKQKHLYSDIVSSDDNGLYITIGVDFNYYSENKKEIGLSIFYEGGRLVGSAQFNNFIWENYDYSFSEISILLAHRLGISIHMPFAKKQDNSKSKK